MKKFKTTTFFVLLIIITMILLACGVEEEPPQADQDNSDTLIEVPEQTPPAAIVQELDDEQAAELFSRGQDLDELYYEMNMVTYEMGAIELLVWMKGERMRVETELMDQHIIMIYDTDAVYTLDPQERSAFKMPIDVNMDGADPFTSDDITDEFDSGNLEYLGIEEYDGITCHVIQSTDPQEGHVVRMWLHPENGFPMKMESVTDVPEEQYLMEVTELRVTSVSDDVFMIPPEYDMIDLTEMFNDA
jgi:outer membrane lipoprotein-sorting protein